MASFLSAAAAVVLALWSLPATQTRPDFSGTWTIDVERSESPHQGPAFEPPTFVIAQTAAEVTIETRRRSGSSRTTYPLVASGQPDPGGTPGALRAYWEGDTLVTEGQRLIQGQTVSVRETRSLDATGTEMTLRSLLVVQHGYTFKGAQSYGAATDVYLRASPPRELTAIAASAAPAAPDRAAALTTAASRPRPDRGPRPR